jgi:predicted DNA-binding protein (MmcQ/YjbR family)
MPPSPITGLRKTCLALPGAHEVEAWGEPTFRVKNKIFAMFASAANHHGAGRNAVWLKSTKENQARLIQAEPERYFKPPYVGPSGWIGIWLDRGADWDLVAEFIRESYCLIAPAKLIAQLDA